MQDTGKTKRLEWLDAMRGFTMILVVAQHVLGMGFGLDPKHSSAQELLTLFRMPLFFFVSGFLAYKSSVVWTGGVLGSSLIKKVRVQLIPTAVFLLSYLIYKYKDVGEHLLDALANSNKSGYWFTWVLLLMFVVYYLFEWLTARRPHKGGVKGVVLGELKELRELKELKTNDLLTDMWSTKTNVFNSFNSLNSFNSPKTTTPLTSLTPLTPQKGHGGWLVLLWVASLVLYETAYLPKVFTYTKSAWAAWLSLDRFAMYFVFFVSGNIVRRYWHRMESLFDSRWFFPSMIVVAYVCCAEIFKWHNLKFEWRNLPLTIAIFALLSIIIMFFRHHEHVFSKETLMGRVMQYIGTRTLDVYLIHYFFIPHLPMVGPFLKEHRPNIVIEEVLSIGLALAVVAFCCLTSSLLRTSPLLKKYLFGRPPLTPPERGEDCASVSEAIERRI